MAKVAVVLAGCGAKDGSEITEAISLMICLQQSGHEISLFAPDRKKAHIVNHLTQQESVNESRNILVEAGRIARGNVKPLSHVNVNDFDALTFPGGFGVAKNLCDFAFKGAEAKLEDDVKSILLPFLKAQKPVAALCIAPVLLALGARELNLKNLEITLGDGSAEEAVNVIKKWGCAHIPCYVWQAHVDIRHRVVTSPAYMHDDASTADIFESARSLVNGLNSLLP